MFRVVLRALTALTAVTAATSLAVLPVTSAVADDAGGVMDPTTGCAATSPSSPYCQFTTSGPVRYVAAGAGGWQVDVLRSGQAIYSLSGNLSDFGYIPTQRGDLIVAKTTGVACRIEVREAA